MTNLTARLRQAAKLVPPSRSMADIGTDHAYLSLALLEEGKIRAAIASDIHKGPLERARFHIKEQGKEGQIELRLGGGLAPLQKGEVDGVTIAGMGGLMMRDILEADMEKAQALSWLVLQPQNHVAELKQYLSTHHFRIIKEEMALEDRRLYEMMLAVPGSMREISLLEGEIGATEGYRQHPLFHEHICRLIRKRDFLINGVAPDTDNERNRRKREKALAEKAELEALL